MRDDEPDFGMSILIGLCVGLLIVCAIGIVKGVQGQKRETDFLTANQCKLHMQYPTGERRYCGKACSRAEELYLYHCSFGTHVIVR